MFRKIITVLSLLAGFAFAIKASMNPELTAIWQGFGFAVGLGVAFVGPLISIRGSYDKLAMVFGLVGAPVTIYGLFTQHHPLGIPQLSSVAILGLFILQLSLIYGILYLHAIDKYRTRI